MHAKHATIDDRAKRQIIENLAAPPPDVAIPVFPLALVVKSINLRYLPGFVVPPNEGDTFRITDFEGEEEK